MNPVPLIYVGSSIEVGSITKGALSDIAPTMLHIMGLKKPSEMTGQSLLIEPSTES
jgi:2,3-bisphosphoglycerate-independent phosphoglycerate mutase